MKALIVGAGQGLSASLARLFTREGMRVVLASRRPESLEALCAETGARAYRCEATDPSQVEKLFESATESESLDVVVYNASARARGAVADLTPTDVQRALMISAFGGFLVG